MHSKEMKKIVKEMYSDLVREKSLKSTLKSINDPLGRASAFSGISRRTIKRWVDEKPVEKPKVTTKLHDFKCIDEFDIDIIMRTIRKLWDNKEPVFLMKLLKLLYKEHDMEISKMTLYRVMKKKGLIFKNTRGNRKILMERADLQIERAKYLRNLKDFKEKDAFELNYMDETWVNANHTHSKEWVGGDESLGRVIPVGRGKRLIEVNAISSSGLVPGCGLLFSSESDDNRDYHKEMNAKIFEEWVSERLLPALDTFSRPAVVIMDNASYHCSADNKVYQR